MAGGGSATPLGKLVDFLAAEQPVGSGLRAATALLVLAAISVRCAIGLHPYSGMGKPPMFGDFEAQRHWMELTTSLPLADWYAARRTFPSPTHFPIQKLTRPSWRRYRNTEQNDLQYWGLDYPPLTAYHSWVCGKVLGWLDPASMELTTSRGYETPDHKAAMRAAVLVRTRRKLPLKRAPSLSHHALTRVPAGWRLPVGRGRNVVLPSGVCVRERLLSRGLQPRPTLDRCGSLDATAAAPHRPRTFPIQRDLARPPRARVGSARQVIGDGQAGKFGLDRHDGHGSDLPWGGAFSTSPRSRPKDGTSW